MSVLLGRLYALREQLDAVIDSVENPPAVPKDETGCEHPLERRKYAGATMGEAPSFTCEQCNAVVPVASTEQILHRVVRRGPTPEGA